MNLNGWQRLFVIATVLWLLYSGFLALQGFAERKRLGEVSALIGLIKRETPEARLPDYRRSLGHIPLGQFKGMFDVQLIAANEKLVSPARADELAWAAYAEYGQSQDRTDDIFDMLKGWLLAGLIIPAVVYGVGLVGAWVTRGFRTKSKGSTIN